MRIRPLWISPIKHHFCFYSFLLFFLFEINAVVYVQSKNAANLNGIFNFFLQ